MKHVPQKAVEEDERVAWEGSPFLPVKAPGDAKREADQEAAKADPAPAPGREPALSCSGNRLQRDLGEAMNVGV